MFRAKKESLLTASSTLNAPRSRVPSGSGIHPQEASLNRGGVTRKMECNVWSLESLKDNRNVRTFNTIFQTVSAGYRRSSLEVELAARLDPRVQELSPRVTNSLVFSPY